MKKIICLIGITFTLGAGLNANERDQGHFIDASGGVYIFLGAELRAQYRSKLLPVVSADEKGMYVDAVKGLKRVRFNSSCSFEPRVSMSQNFVQVEAQNITFDYVAKSRREAAAMSDVMRAAASTDLEVLKLNDQMVDNAAPGSAEEARNMEIGDEISDLEFNQNNLEEQVRNAVDGDEFDRDGISDTVYMKLTLTPLYDVEDAYCALVVNYIEDDAYARYKGRMNSSVRVRKIGDLLGGVPNKVSMSATMAEGIYEDSNCEVYVFSGDGKPIALSSSQGLKLLTEKQLLRMQELEAKTASKG